MAIFVFVEGFVKEYMSTLTNGAKMLLECLAREGVGLGNTRARLQHLYGDRHHLTLTTAPGAGFAVDIDVPYRI